MTSLSDAPDVQITGEPVVPLKRGRPTGVKNGVKKKKPVKKVAINMEAILANSEVKKLNAEVTRLKEELDLTNAAFKGAELHIEALEKKHKAALIVVGYLEGKIFRE
jgi:copper chaperone CopZ